MQFDQYGDADVLHPGNLATPDVVTGWLRIKVAAVGVNPADFKWRQGMFRDMVPLKFPHVVGYDVAGVVEAVGAAVTAFRVGDRIVASVRGAYAEFAVADEKACAQLPAALDFATGASLPCAGLTGVQLIEAGIRPARDQTVLITGATGAVGRFAVHAALGLGAHVLAAVRPAYFDAARELGVHGVLNLGATGADAAAVGLVADTVGGPEVANLCRKVAPGSTILTVSTTPIDPAGLAVKPAFFPYHPDGARLARLLAAVAAGNVAMPIARRLPLAAAAEAHRLLENGGLKGKIILEL
jgi:NADPH:quinone reductase